MQQFKIDLCCNIMVRLLHDSTNLLQQGGYALYDWFRIHDSLFSNIAGDLAAKAHANLGYSEKYSRMEPQMLLGAINRSLILSLVISFFDFQNDESTACCAMDLRDSMSSSERTSGLNVISEVFLPKRKANQTQAWRNWPRMLRCMQSL